MIGWNIQKMRMPPSAMPVILSLHSTPIPQNGMQTGRRLTIFSGGFASHAKSPGQEQAYVVWKAFMSGNANSSISHLLSVSVRAR
jgi:hypothetical protein